MLRMKNKIKQFHWQFEKRTIPIGVGCAWLGRAENSAKKLDSERRLLLKCYEAGMRYFDTSRSYGQSEISVGAFVKEVNRESIFLATKSMFRGETPFESFKKNFYESFERLQTDYIDLYQIHDTDNYVICTDEVIPFMLERKKEGMIHYIGMGTRFLTAHAHAVADGHVDSVLSYLDYNLLSNSALPLMKLTREYDVAFINSSALVAYLLKGDIDGEIKESRGLNRKRAVFAKEMINLCAGMGIDVLTAALQYSLLNPDVDILLNGIASPEDLESTIKIMKSPLYPEQWAAISSLQRTYQFIDIQQAFY